MREMHMLNAYWRCNMKSLYTLAFISLAFGCAATSSGAISPVFSGNNGTDAFFDQQLVIQQAEEFKVLETKVWSYEFDLKSPSEQHEIVETCSALTEKINAGYSALRAYEQVAVNARVLTCEIWRVLSLLKPASVSYLQSLKHGSALAEKMPAELALIISKDDERRLAKASSWQDMSQISKIEIINADQAVYYDNSGGIQRLTIRARGDYNQDGIEDAVLYMGNSVDGGSYSSTYGYIITKLAADAPYTLLKQF